MTTEARVLTRPGPWSRIAGLGTIYGKTVRDSWRAALVVGGVASLFMIGTGAPYGFAPEFSTVELRRAFIAGLTSLPPALRGLLGEPINLETMGGFLSWRVGNTLPVLLGPVAGHRPVRDARRRGREGQSRPPRVDAPGPADDRAREAGRSCHGGHRSRCCCSP